MCDVTLQDLVDGDLITTVYLRRGRWRNDKKLGSWRLRLTDKNLTDGVPRSFTGCLSPTDKHKDVKVRFGVFKYCFFFKKEIRKQVPVLFVNVISFVIVSSDLGNRQNRVDR